VSRIEKAMQEAAKMRERLEQEEGPPTQTDEWYVVKGVRTEHQTPASVQGSSPGNRRSAPIVKANITSPLIVTQTRPESREAEEYRRLRAMLTRLTGGKGSSNVIAVTSSVASEGKTVTALNLSIAFAHDFDHTALLIDADIRKSSLSSYMNIERRKGLSDCILANADPADVIIRTAIGNMSFIPAGSAVENPSEFFSSKVMKKLIHHLKSRYDDRYIIIDTPPVLAFSETMRICDLADGVILVAQERRTKMADLDETVHVIGRDKVIGVVYTKAFISSLDQRYDRYYRYGYPVETDTRKGNHVRKVL